MKTTIVLRMAEAVGLAALLPGEGIDAGGIEDLYAFCLLDSTCAPDVVIGGSREVIARAIHEDYIMNEAAKGNTPKSNPSMVPWEMLPDDLKESNRQQADHLSIRLKAFDYEIAALTDFDRASFEFSPDEIEGMARMEHERWYEEKRDAGYSYGPGPKTSKTHPDLVPYDSLSEEAKDKDRRMVKGLPRFLAKAGFQIGRIRGAEDRA